MRPTLRRAATGLTTHKLLVAILFVAIAAMAVRQPTDTDTWWHLKSGQLMWQQGEILRTDPFSHTVAGKPWIDHGWLAQIALWAVYTPLGLPGLALLLAALVTAAFFLVYRQCPGQPFIAALATLLGTVASSVIWAIRPQSFSFLLTAILAYLLFRYKETHNPRWLWPVPLLVVLWVNTHGAFVVAFILIGCYLAGEVFNRVTTHPPSAAPIKPLLWVTAISIPAILLNPNGADMIPYAYQTISIGQLQAFIQEWAAPDFHNLQLHPFIWLLLLTLAAMGLSRRRADWTDLALVGVFGYMGLVAVRNVALFALVAPPVLARHTVYALQDLTALPRMSWLAALISTRPVPRPRRGVALLNLLLLALVLGAAGFKIGLDLVRIQDSDAWGRDLPVDAAAYIDTHDLPGPMFNTYNWGGYLIWALYPHHPVFVDGRTDLYALNSDVLDDYATVHWIRPGWVEVLDRYQIGYVITERTGLLDQALGLAGGWQVVHSDAVAVIYVRAGHEP
ncbi:MAG: hypothetical protein JXA93_24685 [Anaerolineae bacterium]|nr:hypothetical protein [Anaerolineae bacterium]